MNTEICQVPSTGVVARVRKFALRYAATPFHPQWFSFKTKVRATERAAVTATGIVLDVGCGNATIRSHLPAHCTYVGLDYPATGKAWYGAQPEVYGDARALPFRSNSVDRVLLLDVLEHLTEPELSLQEAFRVLAAKGQLLINIPCLYPLHDEPRDYQRFTEHGLRRRLMDAGFVDINVEACGAPVETAALLLNIALSKWAADMVRVTPLGLLLVWPLVALIPLVNLAARAVGLVTRGDRFMPYAYFVECAKPSIDAVSSA